MEVVLVQLAYEASKVGTAKRVGQHGRLKRAEVVDDEIVAARAPAEDVWEQVFI